MTCAPIKTVLLGPGEAKSIPVRFSAKIQPNQWVSDEYKSEFSGLLLGRCQVPDGAVVLIDGVWVIGRVIEHDQHRNRKLICTEPDMRTAWYEDDSIIRPGDKIPAKYEIPELVKQAQAALEKLRLLSQDLTRELCISWYRRNINLKNYYGFRSPTKR